MTTKKGKSFFIKINREKLAKSESESRSVWRNLKKYSLFLKLRNRENFLRWFLWMKMWILNESCEIFLDFMHCMCIRERESEEGKGSLMKVGKLIKRTAEMLSSESWGVNFHLLKIVCRKLSILLTWKSF